MKKESENKKSLAIRSSAAEFLLFTASGGENSVEVRFEDENVWLTQKMLATLYDVKVATVNEHLKNIFDDDELDKSATIRKFRIVQTEGTRKVERNTEHYSLQAVIAVGYKVNSARAVQFRKWATEILKAFSIQGYVLDKERMKNGLFLGEDYFEKLLAEIREIRLSERRFYQKITDIYATAMDYDRSATTTKEFFATVQNKLHYAIHGTTAAEAIKTRASAKQENMGLTNWAKSPKGKILKTDVTVAKNYLDSEELEQLERIVSLYLDYAELQGKRSVPMTMEDWSQRLNSFLKFNEREILDNPGKVSAEIAKSFAESEFEKYRIIQDKLFESDFDAAMKEIEEKL